ncbi:AbrB family transcriptional regulator [Pseudodonghicola xiamenensis]|uniref:Monooxygenase n=1 Tax=Pseudodonghicola xiamenensis TaxID=337702 RepID=A0A8J3HCV4_9RHOB|nr:AbrB family transcriptional regulator [Pseudodonghicola xiamenensis]GHH03281.1 monooxygenase [Pseudodonghicola xiamenensis]
MTPLSLPPARPVDIAKKLGQLGLILALAAIGAWAARHLGLPIPNLLGSLTASAALSLFLYARMGRRLWFPMNFRAAFIGVIGAMIGSSFSPSLWALAPSLALSFLVMSLFITAAWSLNFAIFRRLGGYDRPTALYSALPGGLIEAVSLGEQAGGNVEILSLQQFMRIVAVVVSVPALLTLWTGHAVGSAAGLSLEHAPADLADWLSFLVIVPLGMWLGRRLSLPAWTIVGPMLVSAVLQGTGLWDVNGPGPLLAVAQLVVGAGLGTMFARSTFRHIAKGFGLALISVSAMLALGGGLSLLLTRLVPIPLETLLISFSPGGVTEMSLIALSLGADPVLVTAHHLFRILFTVLAASAISKRLARKSPSAPGA